MIYIGMAEGVFYFSRGAKFPNPPPGNKRPLPYNQFEIGITGLHPISFEIGIMGLQTRLPFYRQHCQQGVFTDNRGYVS